MPDGSPIDKWWKSHRPAVVSTVASSATHLIGDRWPRAYCGHRGGTQTTLGADVTCSACISARTADAEAAS